MDSPHNKTDTARPQVIIEIDLRYTPSIAPASLPMINSPQEAYDCFKSSWDASKLELLEEFKVMLLNRSIDCSVSAEYQWAGLPKPLSIPR